MINADFAAHLLTVAPIASIVGTQVYPQIAPQSASLPYITFFDVFDGPVQDTTGPTGYVEKRLQVDCWGATYSDAKRLAYEVRTALDGYSGTWNLTTIRYCLQTSEIDQHEPPTSGGEKGKHRVILEFNIAYDQTGA